MTDIRSYAKFDTGGRSFLRYFDDPVIGSYIIVSW